jgi:hypothetical protein
MTASEWTFLILGLAFGIVSGATLMEILRSRPPSPREVRLTVAHNAIPRRAATLADDAFAAVRPEPARGGPADRRSAPAALAPGAAERRTNVLSGPARRPFARPGTDPSRRPATALAVNAASALGLSASTTRPGIASASGGMVAVAVSGGDDPVLRDLSASTGTAPTLSPTGRVAIDHPAETAADPSAPAGLTAVALLDPPGGGAAPEPAATQRCAEERRRADERCELATRAKAQAETAAEALRTAQRRYDEHESAAVTAAWRADPRAVHQAKDAAQVGFRAAVAAATTPDALEDAARDWLNEINRINVEAREAKSTADREHAAAATIGADLDRLALEADAARISAETADAACLAARSAVAECEEATAARPVEPSPSIATASPAPRLDEDEALTVALDAGDAPVIFRLLRGDRQAMTSLVATLAGDGGDDRRHWQLLMTGLVEAIVANAIEAAALEFPEDHLLWGLFTRDQDRDIAHALASLGYRFDGLGGWIDDRHPSQRDLSLALGYAGLDPMRIRQWPDNEETEQLFSEVTVAADEYLAGVAGDLTLAEMVTMLGRRADPLAEVWNDWGRIRPLLLAEG